MTSNLIGFNGLPNWLVNCSLPISAILQCMSNCLRLSGRYCLSCKYLLIWLASIFLRSFSWRLTIWLSCCSIMSIGDRLSELSWVRQLFSSFLIRKRIVRILSFWAARCKAVLSRLSF